MSSASILMRPAAHAASTAAALPPPATPARAAAHSITRLEHDSLVLAHQFQTMVTSLQSATHQLSELTVEYMRSMESSVRSSASAVDILIDTHTSLIRKLLIAVQQTSGVDQLEKQVAQTKVALGEIERAVEKLLEDDAIRDTKRQLQRELQPHMMSTSMLASTAVLLDDEESHAGTPAHFVIRGAADLESADLAAEQTGTALTPMRLVSAPPSRQGTPGPPSTEATASTKQQPLPPPSFAAVPTVAPKPSRPGSKLPDLPPLEPL